jgi:hypothetical protein
LSRRALDEIKHHVAQKKGPKVILRRSSRWSIRRRGGTAELGDSLDGQ